QTVSMRREFWATPANAADMRKWRGVIEGLSADFAPEPSLPEIKDPHLKQVLIPVDDGYVSITPVASMGVLHELYQRLYEQGLPFFTWVVQPTVAAMANHGEALLLQSGKVRMLRRGLAQIAPGSWRGDFVQLTARC